MARRARLQYPGMPLHVVQKGHNQDVCFFTEADYAVYLESLQKFAKRHACQIHAYVLLPNHVHLLVSSSRANGIGQMMKAVGQCYVQYVNRLSGRSGTLWAGRYRSCVVQPDPWLLHCQHYIETNPVRSGLVTSPEDYRWSSYHANALGQSDVLLKPHALYLELGADEVERHWAYRELFPTTQDEQVLAAIRTATRGNYALGDTEFAAQVAQKAKQRTTPGKAGRPRKNPPVTA